MTEDARIVLRALHRLSGAKRKPIGMGAIAGITKFDEPQVGRLLNELADAFLVQRSGDEATITFSGIEAVGSNFEGV